MHQYFIQLNKSFSISFFDYKSCKHLYMCHFCNINMYIKFKKKPCFKNKANYNIIFQNIAIKWVKLIEYFILKKKRPIKSRLHLYSYSKQMCTSSHLLYLHVMYIDLVENHFNDIRTMITPQLNSQQFNSVLSGHHNHKLWSSPCRNQFMRLFNPSGLYGRLLWPL